MGTQVREAWIKAIMGRDSKCPQAAQLREGMRGIRDIVQRAMEAERQGGCYIVIQASTLINSVKDTLKENGWYSAELLW